MLSYTDVQNFMQERLTSCRHVYLFCIIFHFHLSLILNNSLSIPSVLGFHTLQWLFDLFSGEHNVDAGTELFNELLVVCDKAIVFFVKLNISFF